MHRYQTWYFHNFINLLLNWGTIFCNHAIIFFFWLQPCNNLLVTTQKMRYYSWYTIVYRPIAEVPFLAKLVCTIVFFFFNPLFFWVISIIGFLLIKAIICVRLEYEASRHTPVGICVDCPTPSEYEQKLRKVRWCEIGYVSGKWPSYPAVSVALV